MKKNTLSALNESISDSSRVRRLILDNIINKKEKGIRLNLVYITYDFSSNKVLIEYYAKDDEYPNVEMSFDELNKFLKNSYL